MHLAGPILVVIAGELTGRIADRLVVSHQSFKRMQILYSSVETTLPGTIVRVISGPIVTCFTFSSIRMAAWRTGR
jgi:hypothetical protein